MRAASATACHAKPKASKVRAVTPARPLTATLQALFVAMVSHEVRTPLSVVSGAAGLLISSPHTAEQEELIDLVELGAQNVVSIINDMLHFGQLEFGEFRTTYEPIRLVRVQREILKEV